MTNQELMLNQSANLNFQYNNKLYKVSINIHDGLILVKEVVAEDKTEILSVLSLKNIEEEV